MNNTTTVKSGSERGTDMSHALLEEDEIPDLKEKLSEAEGGSSEEPEKPKLNAMSPLAASSTVVNLLLATGPFS
jgi:hypothetical protein